jgi:F0F1-type ATP synthase delta subunit
MAKITFQQLAVYAVDQLEAGMAIQDVARNISAYLLQERRSREVSSVIRAIEAELNKRGKTQVVVTSAHTVSDDVKQQLAELLGAKNAVFHDEIDPNVIGGVKARSGETEIDLTVRGRLNRFKTQIVSGGNN